MTNYPPEHCPYCGAELRAVEPPTAFRCAGCDRPVFHNPTPAARVAVVDGDALLLAEIGAAEASDLWTVPGGMVEVGEEPQEAAARELREETGLVVDPADLALFDAREFAKFGRVHKLRISYAVERRAAGGALSVGDEPADVRFWTPDELAASDRALTDDQPEPHRALSWWLREARTALDGG